jgi:hypothetical protein
MHGILQESVELMFVVTGLALLLRVMVRRPRVVSVSGPYAGFSERAFAWGGIVLSTASWIVSGHTFKGAVFRLVVIGAVLVVGLTYFVTKSVLTRALRWRVAAVLMVPAIEMAYELKILPAPILRTCEAVVGH